MTDTAGEDDLLAILGNEDEAPVEPAGEAAADDLLDILDNEEADQGEERRGKKRSKEEKQRRKEEKKEKKKQKKAAKKAARAAAATEKEGNDEKAEESDEEEDEEDVLDFSKISDEEDDEEEEDEESEGSVRSGSDAPPRKKSRGDKKKKKKSKRSRFLDDAAESDESEESMAPLPEELDEELADISYIEKHKQKRDFFGEQEGDTAEDIARAIEQRAQERKEKEEYMRQFGGEAAGAVTVWRDILPRPEDAGVFAVKCRPNTAKQIVARLTNKCFQYRIGNNHERKPIDLGIISCFSLDHVKEWIYVESHRQMFVENAVNGLENLFRYKIVRIDPSELIQLLMNAGNPKENVRVGELARLRQHPYREDLCQVVELLEGGKRAKVKVVPREDFVGKAAVKETRKKDAVPRPQRFFVPDLALGVHQRGDRFIWGEREFNHTGYLMKIVPTRGLMFGSKFRKPDMREIAFFMKDNKDKIADAASFSNLTDAKIDFNLGDTVRVSRGQLHGTIGRIVDIVLKDGTAVIECVAPGHSGTIQLTVELIECSKYFEDGSHIQVISGPMEGDSGTVVASTGELVIFLSNNTLKEEEARSNDCRQGQIRPKERTAVGTRQLYDMVQLTDQVVGIITGLTNVSFTILTLENAQKKVGIAQVKQTLRSRVECIDGFGNKISRREAVIVLPMARDSRILNRTGEVLQIYSDKVFLRVNTPGRDSIVTCLPGKYVRVHGGVSKIGEAKTYRREQYVPDRPVYIARPPSNLSARYDAPSQPWQSTQVWEGEGEPPQ